MYYGRAGGLNSLPLQGIFGALDSLKQVKSCYSTAFICTLLWVAGRQACSIGRLLTHVLQNICTPRSR